MGYRSDVKVITTKQGWEKLDKAVKEVAGITKENEENTYYLTEDGNWTPICNRKYVLAEWDDIKWYDGYDDQITAFMEALKCLDHDSTPYEFMRVGEDYGDIEYLSGCSTWQTEYDDMPMLELKREIEVDYGTTKL